MLPSSECSVFPSLTDCFGERYQQSRSLSIQVVFAYESPSVNMNRPVVPLGSQIPTRIECQASYRNSVITESEIGKLMCFSTSCLRALPFTRGHPCRPWQPVRCNSSRTDDPRQGLAIPSHPLTSFGHMNLDRLLRLKRTPSDSMLSSLVAPTAPRRGRAGPVTSR